MPLNAAQLKFCAMEMQHKQGRHLSKLKPDGVPSANISPAPKMGKQNPRQMLHPHLAGRSFPPSTTTITNEKINREIDDVVSLSLSPFLSPFLFSLSLLPLPPTLLTLRSLPLPPPLPFLFSLSSFLTHSFFLFLSLFSQSPLWPSAKKSDWKFRERGEVLARRSLHRWTDKQINKSIDKQNNPKYMPVVGNKCAVDHRSLKGKLELC